MTDKAKLENMLSLPFNWLEFQIMWYDGSIPAELFLRLFKV